MATMPNIQYFDREPYPRRQTAPTRIMAARIQNHSRRPQWLIRCPISLQMWPMVRFSTAKKLPAELASPMKV